MAIDILRAQQEFRQRFDAGGAGFDGNVTSFWRSLEHNKAVGGAPMSQHLYGLAADVVPPRSQWQALAASMRRAGLVVIDEASHLHVQLFPAGQIQREGISGPITAWPGSANSTQGAPKRAASGTWRYHL